MNEVIERLMTGDQSVVAQFKSSAAFWAEFFAEHSRDTDADLAHAIGMAQGGYEAIFHGDRIIAKETMPFTALGHLYDTGAGFEDNRALAIRTVKAFMAAPVSIEVQGAMRDAAKLYNLDEEPEVEEAFRW